MAVLYFSDVLNKVGIDPKKVKLIRHTYAHETFRACVEKRMILEYTSHQKKGFSKGYEYWCVFVAGKGTYAKFISMYKVGDSKSDTPDMIPEGLPESEARNYSGENEIYELEKLNLLEEYENKLIIEWGNSARMWHQKGTTEKPIISIQLDEKKVFSGYEFLVLSYDHLKEIVENETVYSEWHTALKSVYAIYLIVDTETGKQYVGSAYGNDGLLGRWRCYVATQHGNNKLMKQVVCEYPERYHAFQFSILQILPKTITDEEVIKIESKWKEKLLSIKFGMNDN